jgi:hypothetical protein
MPRSDSSAGLAKVFERSSASILLPQRSCLEAAPQGSARFRSALSHLTGAPERIRTSDPQIRSLVVLADTTTLSLPQSTKNDLYLTRTPTQAALPRHELALLWLLDGS